MNRRFSVVLGVVIIMGLGMVAGTGCQSAQTGGDAGKSASDQSARQAPNSGGPGGQNRGGNGPQGNRQPGGFGTVNNVSASGFTLASQGGQLDVVTSGDTKVTRMTEAKVSDLKVGDSVFATGSQQADGSVAAASIQVDAADGQRGMAGGFGNRQGQPGPGSQGGQNQGNGANGQGPRGPQANGTPGPRGSFVNGSIEAINGNTITIKAQSGTSSKVTVGNDTTVQRLADGSLSDIKNGQSAVVDGERNAAGALVATSIELVPAGMTPGGR